MDIIKSASNRRVKYVKALRSKARLRRGEGKLILEGDRLIGDALQSGGKPDQALYVPESADYALVAALQDKGCQLLPVSQEVLRQVSDTQRAPGLLAVFHIPRPPLPQRAERALILDAIGEPGNLGAILRSATAAAADIAILSPGNADPYNPKALRAAMGAHFRLPIVEANWRELRAYCADLRVYAAEAGSETRYTDVEWRDGWALIIGNEAHGLSREARSLSAVGIAIPMAARAESLNAAAAAAVILFEARRQRMAAVSKVN